MNLETEQPYRVQLPVFEGPLDLLLHLVKKDDLDIQNIPISAVLNQYLEYLRLAQELNVDLAGEFLDMAAELAYIKSKTLLPEPEGEPEEGIDPRVDLVRKLLEYRKYKLAASLLIGRPLLGRDVFKRTSVSFETAGDETIEADTVALLSAFQELLKRIPKDKNHEVYQERVGVAERILELVERIRGQILFEALFREDRSRGELVVTFLAILEMARQRLIRVVQERTAGAIVVCPLVSEQGIKEGDPVNHERDYSES